MTTLVAILTLNFRTITKLMAKKLAIFTKNSPRSIRGMSVGKNNFKLLGGDNAQSFFFKQNFLNCCITKMVKGCDIIRKHRQIHIQDKVS